MPVLAVNHHYFRASGTGRSIYPTTPSALIEEVSILRTNGWRLGGEADILSLVAGELPPQDRVCVLTFDDGLKEQLGALELLEGIGACAVFFVPTAPLMDRIVLDVHKLHMIRERLADAEMAADLDRTFDFFNRPIDEDLSVNQYPYDGALARRVKFFLNFVLDEDQRRHWIHRTFDTLFGDERTVAASLYMDRRDVRMLAARRLLGSHGHGHVPLASLESGEIRLELERSRDILASLTGNACLGISYPFGTKPAMSADVVSGARQAGYRYGFTMTRGVNAGDTATDPLELRRVNSNELSAYVASAASSVERTR